MRYTTIERQKALTNILTPKLIFGINFTQHTFRFPYVFKVLHGKYLLHTTMDYKFSLSFTYIVKECRIFITEVPNYGKNYMRYRNVNKLKILTLTFVADDIFIFETLKFLRKAR